MQLLASLNDESRLPYPVHIRTETTRSWSSIDIADAIADALVRAHVLPGCTALEPSKNKWGTMFKALEPQAAGFMNRNLVGQAAAHTFRTWADGDRGLGDNDGVVW